MGYKLFGPSPNVSHGISLFFAALCVFGTYTLTKYLAGFWQGVFAAALLLFSPIFFAQAGICTADIFVAALCVWTVHYYLMGKMVPYLLIGICLAMTKLTAIGVFVPIMLYDVCLHAKNGLDFKRQLLLSVPVLLAGVFLGFQYLTTGRFVPNSYFVTNNFFAEFNITALAGKALDIFSFVFIEQLRFIPTAALCVFVIINRNEINRAFYLFFGIILFFIVSFATMFYLTRYITLLLPLYFSMAAIAVFSLMKQRSVIVPALSLLMASFIYLSYNPRANDGRYDVTMKYSDFVRLHQEAAKYMENTFTGMVLLSDSPFEIAVKDPRNGYVSQPIETSMEMGPRVNTAVVFSKPNKQRFGSDVLKENGFLPVKTFRIGSLEFIIFRRSE